MNVNKTIRELKKELKSHKEFYEKVEGNVPMWVISMFNIILDLLDKVFDELDRLGNVLDDSIQSQIDDIYKRLEEIRGIIDGLEYRIANLETSHY